MGRSLPPKRSHAATPEPLSSGASDRTLVAVSDANDTRANPYRRRQIVGTNESRCDVDHVCGYHTSAATRFLGPRSCRCLARRSDCAADPRQPDRPVPALRIAGTRRHQAVMAGAVALAASAGIGVMLAGWLSQRLFRRWHRREEQDDRAISDSDNDRRDYADGRSLRAESGGPASIFVAADHARPV